MYFLLLLLGVCFFFIFFLFSRVTDFNGYFIGSLFIEANIYILISLGACIIAYRQSIISKDCAGDNDLDNENLRQYLPDKNELKDFFISFFSNYIYYIAGLLFYISVYIIAGSFFPAVEIIHIFLVLNTIVFILYFFVKNVNLGKDLIIVNLILVSLYYIGVHILYLFSSFEAFSVIDIINIIAAGVLFCITLLDKEYVIYRKVIEQYFLVFLLLELATLYKYIFSGDITSFGIIAGILGGGLLIFTDEVKKYFHISKNSSRNWGLIFSAVSILIYSCVLFTQEAFLGWYSGEIIVISVLMALFHKRFCSYFGLSAGALGISVVSYFFYVTFFGEEYGNRYIFLVYFALSFLFIGILRKLQTHYSFDRYFFRIISGLVNLIGVITFFFFYEVSILNLGLLLLGESVYLFFIYYSLRKKI